jgi:uncharacterized protein YgbK (DUF1537 family)
VQGEARPLVVLDDDPTGVQTLAGVPVLLNWDAERIRAALDGAGAVHLITNSRALPPERARAVVESAARAAVAGVPAVDVILRGDSTLRGHLAEEYLGLRDAILPGETPPLLLVPALPSAGRVTIDGVHLIERGGRRVPLHETEYAADGVFAYHDARLLVWAAQRSGGLFLSRRGRELALAELRARGSESVVEVIADVAAPGAPAVVAPDVETIDDLGIVAEGYEAAAAAGLRVLVRCAPAFAGVLARTAAAGLSPFPDGREGVLVVCGSYVPTSTRQLDRLLVEHPDVLVEVDAVALASSRPEAEVERAAAAASARLRTGRLAVLATPRERAAATRSLEAGARVAAGLAQAARNISPLPSVVVAKGGITSAVTLQDGFGFDEAHVVGPVLPGVSHWRAAELDYLVVPGNVGEDDLLAKVVAGLLRG